MRTGCSRGTAAHQYAASATWTARTAGSTRLHHTPVVDLAGLLIFREKRRFVRVHAVADALANIRRLEAPSAVRRVGDGDVGVDVHGVDVHHHLHHVDGGPVDVAEADVDTVRVRRLPLDKGDDGVVLGHGSEATPHERALIQPVFLENDAVMRGKGDESVPLAAIVDGAADCGAVDTRRHVRRQRARWDSGVNRTSASVVSGVGHDVRGGVDPRPVLHLADDAREPLVPTIDGANSSVEGLVESTTVYTGRPPSAVK